MSWTLAIETGGTFTDLFMLGPNGEVHIDKVPSTPLQPARAAKTALAKALQLSGARAADVSRLLHGSTVAVNALIERSGTAPALIATRGFRDMLFIGRQEKTHIYDMFYQKPEPFLEREQVYEVTERVAASGAVIETLDVVEATAVIANIIATTGTKTIAICLLHAYANPHHERQLEQIIRANHPGVHVVLSSNVCPVHREFERASTTVINAWLHPVVDAYLGEFGQLIHDAGCAAEPLIMQANGGVLPIDASRKQPAGLYLSGPSAAVAGAIAFANSCGTRSLITLDVGGTSTDVCLITDGEAHESGHGGTCGAVQGQPLNQVMTDIVTIGAGGGSLAWVDAGGMLSVGPQSAGAQPGPACYDRGGTGFTLSDAFLCMGLLADGDNLPGDIQLSLVAAQDAGAPLAAQLGISVAELARSVYRIAVANMAEAIRSVTIRRGLDPRDYALFACGGAGPLVAAPLAEELDVLTVLVPPDPGVFSAFGLTAAGMRMDFARAVEQGSIVDSDNAALRTVLHELGADARRQYRELGLDPASLSLEYSADARYVGQGFELRVTFAADASTQDVRDAFHAAHALRYGHAFSDQAVELTAVRAVASSPVPNTLANWRSAAAHEDTGTRNLQMSEQSVVARVADRANASDASNGPALYLEATSATYVPPRWRADGQASGLLKLEFQP